MSTKTKMLADAIVCAAREHSVPNRFHPAELHAFYGCTFAPMHIGRLARTWLRANSARDGWLVWGGYRIRYDVDCRAFAVELAS